MCNLFLVRHGESYYNKLNLFTGTRDIPLTDNGKHEAIKLGIFFKKFPIDVAYQLFDEDKIRQSLLRSGAEPDIIDDVGMALLIPSLASHITKDSGKEYGASLGILSSVNSLGQVAGVVIGGIIMIWSYHLAYWIVAVILILVTYLLLPKRKLLIQKS